MNVTKLHSFYMKSQVGLLTLYSFLLYHSTSLFFCSYFIIFMIFILIYYLFLIKTTQLLFSIIFDILYLENISMMIKINMTMNLIVILGLFCEIPSTWVNGIAPLIIHYYYQMTSYFSFTFLVATSLHTHDWVFNVS